MENEKKRVLLDNCLNCSNNSLDKRKMNFTGIKKAIDGSVNGE